MPGKRPTIEETSAAMSDGYITRFSKPTSTRFVRDMTTFIRRRGFPF